MDHKNQGLENGELHFENEEQFKYLSSVITD